MSAINKIICNSSVLIDLTQDTVEASSLKYGLTAHDHTGEIITGTSQFFPLEPIVFDFNKGYVDNGTWKYENPTRTYVDIYEVESGYTYFYTLGANVGSRFRAMFTTEDITLLTGGQIVGTKLVNLNNPNPFSNGNFTCESDGYLIIAKDNIGKQNVKSYVFNCTLAWL